MRCGSAFQTAASASNRRFRFQTAASGLAIARSVSQSPGRPFASPGRVSQSPVGSRNRPSGLAIAGWPSHWPGRHRRSSVAHPNRHAAPQSTFPQAGGGCRFAGACRFAFFLLPTRSRSPSLGQPNFRNQHDPNPRTDHRFEKKIKRPGADLGGGETSTCQRQPNMNQEHKDTPIGARKFQTGT